jgi:integrase
MAVYDLTPALIERTTCPPGRKRLDIRDRTIKGWTVEISATGTKTHTFRYFDPSGRLRQVRIGGVNDITFSQARRRAKDLRAETVLGGDPMARKQEKKAVPTYAELAAEHIAEAKRTQRSWWSTEGIIKNHLLPKFGKMRLDEITPQEISRWLGEKAAEGKKEATVDKYRMVLGRSYELARHWRMAGAEQNPVRSVQWKRYDNARQRYLSADEAKALKLACELSSNKSLVHIVGLLILTGARKRELLDARWEHVDLDRRQWLIPQSKNGRSRHVPLSQAAVDVLGQLPRVKDNPWVFPSKTGKPFVSIKRCWATAIDKAGLPGLRIHDLRHSAASFMLNAGIDLFAVGRVLGHKDHKSTMRYGHASDARLAEAVTAGASKLNINWAEATQ